MLIFTNNTEASKSERKTSPADAPSVPTSTPTTVNAGAEPDVSIKSQINQEVEEWPIREMIAILGPIKLNKIKFESQKTLFYELFAENK